jgi:putative hydrolase of the HAD superfamily
LNSCLFLISFVICLRARKKKEDVRDLVSLKGILFDFGYTLAYLDKVKAKEFDEGLFWILKGYGYQKEINDVSSILDKTYEESTTGKTKNILELWKLFLKNLEFPENPSVIRELTDLRERYLTTRLRLFDGVISTLNALKKKFKLALVSNCFTGLYDFLEALNLTPIFNCIILSYEVGMLKPDKRIYLEALRRLNLKPKQCIFVSDQISDLEGAKAIGLKTFLVRQGKLTNRNVRDPNFKPDYECSNIRELLKFL